MIYSLTYTKFVDSTRMKVIRYYSSIEELLIFIEENCLKTEEYKIDQYKHEKELNPVDILSLYSQEIGEYV